MKRKIGIVALSFLIAISFIGGNVAFAKEKEPFMETFRFETKSKDNLSYDVPKMITHNGKKYELSQKPIDYKIVKDNKVKVKKTVKVKDKTDIKKEITENGVKLTLKKGDDGINWKDTYRTAKTIERKYANKSDIPKEISSTVNEDGKTIDIKLKQTNIKTGNKKQNFKAPAKFYGYPDSDIFVFNGKEVKITGNKPIWNGYKEDVAKYLKMNGSYTIKDGNWNRSAKSYEDMYVREATFTGTKIIPYYTATFVETDETRGEFTAEVIYEGIDKNKPIIAEAKALYYEVDAGLTTLAKALLTLAGLVILASIVAIIMYLKKKRKEEN